MLNGTPTILASFSLAATVWIHNAVFSKETLLAPFCFPWLSSLSCKAPVKTL